MEALFILMINLCLFVIIKILISLVHFLLKRTYIFNNSPFQTSTIWRIKRIFVIILINYRFWKIQNHRLCLNGRIFIALLLVISALTKAIIAPGVHLLIFGIYV